jgi:archaellum component FlaC
MYIQLTPEQWESVVKFMARIDENLSNMHKGCEHERQAREDMHREINELGRDMARVKTKVTFWGGMAAAAGIVAGAFTSWLKG